jgi:heptosyltransferase II
MTSERFLVIRFSSLGDIILLTPLFRAIRRQYPGARVDFLTSTTFADLCCNDPHIDRIIAFDRSKPAQAELKRIRQLYRSAGYDWVLDAHHSLRSRLLLASCHGPLLSFNRRIVHIDKRSWQRNLLLLTGINCLKATDSQRLEYLKLLKPDGHFYPEDQQTALYPGAAEKQRIDNLLHQYGLFGQPLVAIGPGASFPGKCWPKERFLETAKHLIDGGYPVVLVGGAQDPEPGWISARTSDHAVDLAGRLSFLETAELMRHCRLVISNDTAVVHFGEAMGVPAIALFGPTVAEFGFAPFLAQSRLLAVDLSCRPCSRNGKGRCHNAIHRRCLTEIQVGEVLKEALQILAR